ncbi:hypothetical protein FQN55_006763 [Onygenales sp. PD_40]|nr:hypothetical protein FQN55_006763 [Onygenales sp. PD_40]
MDTDLPAVDLYNDCVKAAERCHHATKHDPKLNPSLYTRLFDLSLWACAAGVFAPAESSLDSRLKTYPPEVDIVKGNLFLLQHSFEEYEKLAQQGQAVNKALEGIDIVMGNLDKYAESICWVPRRARAHPADLDFNAAEHRELEMHLQCLILLRPTKDGRQGLDPARLTSMQRRLIDANLLRRNRFLSFQRHANTPEASRETQPPNWEDTWTARDPVRDKSAVPSSIISERHTQTDAMPEIASSSGIASPPEDETHLIEGGLDQSSGESGTTLITTQACYPEPPSCRPSQASQAFFRCPCCSQPLSMDDMAHDTEWRNHILEDLCPYTCIKNDCPTPNLLYSKREEWEYHVRNDHPPAWECYICYGHKPLFSESTSLLAHLQAEHGRIIDENNMPTVVSMAKVNPLGIENCPLCEYSGRRDSGKLTNHVLKHMHDFSLRSLPWGSQSPTAPVSPVGTFNTEIPDSDMLLQWLINVDPKMSVDITQPDIRFSQLDFSWLTSIDCRPHQSKYLSMRYPGTGQWFLRSRRFQMWRNSKKQTLFCPGIPGSGKSVITSIVIQELIENLEHSGDIGIAYAYCNFQQRYNDTDLLASLIKQLIQGQRSLPDNVQSLHRTHQRTQTGPSFGEMSTVFQSVAALYSRVFIFIDALDEYQVSATSREKFLEVMFDLQDKHGANLFVTSRFVPDITEAFSASTWLPIEANNQDVEAYVEGHMQGVPSHPCSSEPLLDELKTAILDAARGMFILAPMYIRSLHGTHLAQDVRDALNGFQENTFAKLDFLEPIYGPIVWRIFSHPDATLRHLANQVFLWIACAPSPLTAPQLQHALAVKIGGSKLAQNNLRSIKDIVSACAGLVVVDNETSIVKFVHSTAHEYFRQTREKWFPNAESDLAKICITYLSYSDFETGCCRTHAQLAQRLQSYPLYSYASKNWGGLVRKGMAPNEPNDPSELDKLNRMTVNFLQHKMKTKASGQALLDAQPNTLQTFGEKENLTFALYGLHLAAFFGLEEPTRTLLRKENVDLEDTLGRTPLWYALRAPHIAVVKLLLEHRANIGRVPRVNGLTPLLWAFSEGQEDVAQLLLDSGVNIEECSLEDEQTPLIWASINKQERLVELLIDKGAKIDARDRYGRTPLFYAAMNGHEAIATILLDVGVDIQTRALCFLKDRRRDIFAKMHKNDLPAEKFITLHDLDQIWNDLYLATLGELVDGKRFDEETVDFIRRNLLRTLSILIHIRWDEWQKFGNMFVRHTDDTGTPDRVDEKFEVATLFDLEGILEDNSWASLFYDQISTFYPITIKEGESHEPARNERLPFINGESLPIGQGAYGKVTKGIIAAGQFISSEDGKPFGYDKPVALKTFVTRYGFRQEAENLKQLSSSLRKHDRVVRHLATIAFELQFNIILPLADCDLEEFLKRDTIDDIPMQELVFEAQSIADALHCLHEWIQQSQGRVVCFHMDLKPSNILVFPSNSSRTGTWKISDFGISTFAAYSEGDAYYASSEATVSTAAFNYSETSSTSTIGTTPPRGFGTYQAPEVGHPRAYGTRSDVWSFGCILTRVLCRGLDGVVGLETFDERRGTEDDRISKYPNDYFHRDSVLNPHVKSWLQGLSLNYPLRNPDFLKGWELLLSSMLAIRKDERPTAQDVYKDLGKIRGIPADIAPQKDEPNPSPDTHRRPSADPVRYLVLAIDGGNYEDIQSQLDILPSKDYLEFTHEGDTPLIRTVRLGSEQGVGILAILKEYHPSLDFNSRGSRGMTALTVAAEAGDYRMVRALLESCEDTTSIINTGASNGMTALMLAARHGHEDVVKLLLDNDADCSTQCNSGDTALHYATYGPVPNALMIIRLLKDRVGNVDLPNRGGRTPLHFAMERYRRHPQILDTLLDLRANPNIEDTHQDSPLSIAVHGDYGLVVKFMEHGGKWDRKIPNDIQERIKRLLKKSQTSGKTRRSSLWSFN